MAGRWAPRRAGGGVRSGSAARECARGGGFGQMPSAGPRRVGALRRLRTRPGRGAGGGAARDGLRRGEGRLRGGHGAGGGGGRHPAALARKDEATRKITLFIS